MSDRVPDAGALKAAELLSTIGAAVLGGAFALPWPASADRSVAVLVVGLLVHATDRLQRGMAQPAWSRWLMALCWAPLVVLAAALAWHIGNP